MNPVVIVGGGISGLSAAYDLAKAGVDHLLIEKEARVGGVIETDSWEGCVLERGPDSFISQKPEAMALIKELGLEREVIGSKDGERKTYIVRGGRLLELPEGVRMFVPSKVMPLLKSPLLGIGTKMRMGLELLRRSESHPDRSVAEFVVDHFGQETLDYLAEPLLAGVYGGDPKELSAESTLPRFVEMERTEGSLGRAALKAKAAPSSGPLFRTLKGGLACLTATLASKVSLRRGEAEALEPINGGWRVRVDGEWIEASQVVLACPAFAAAKLVGGSLGKLLDMIPYSSAVVVSLVYRAAEFDGMRAGSGFLVPKVERRRLLACTYMGTKFPNRVPDDKIALRCFFGGISDGDVLQESDDALITMASQELRRLVGLTAAPIHTSVSRWPRSMAQYIVGHDAVLEGIARETLRLQPGLDQPGLHLAGNAYSGIGIPDCIRMGRAAAKRIVESGIKSGILGQGAVPE